jgi:hypothetical protein
MPTGVAASDWGEICPRATWSRLLSSTAEVKFVGYSPRPEPPASMTCWIVANPVCAALLVSTEDGTM